ncbi:MAG: hypothetical protein MK135_02620 [Polyangiaceae bacterium]|nr:hypothetical protein [Polyangiaceae bacterium]
MDTQANRSGRRRRRKKKAPAKPTTPVEPVIVAARRPDSPRLEKPTRRMKAASAKPRSQPSDGGVREGRLAHAQVAQAAEQAPKKRREARIIQRKEGEIDDRERSRRHLLHQFMNSDGRAAVTRAADNYHDAGFELPQEQDAQIRLLEHFDEAIARGALRCLATLLDQEEPAQLPVLRQRLRRLEENAEETSTQEEAAELLRLLPAS